MAELSAAMVGEFERLAKDSAVLTQLEKQLKSGKATYQTAHTYALRVSDLLNRSMWGNLSQADLDNPETWAALCKKNFPPAIKAGFKRIAYYASEVQNLLNTEAGIGLKPVTVTATASRVNGIATHAAKYTDFAQAKTGTEQLVENILLHAVDQTAKANASALYSAGISSKIVRTSNGKCCDWCDSRVGVFDYPGNVDSETFRRHGSCRCVIEEKIDGKTVNTIPPPKDVSAAAIAARTAKING